MRKTTTDPDSERFQTGAAKYADYLETPEGRLRLDLAFANLQEFLLSDPRSLHALDLGGGTGANALRLARLGFHVTVMDFSTAMLDIAEHSAREAGLSERIRLKQGDATQLATLCEAGSFDLILCHNVLEFVEDPCEVLRDAARLLRSPSGMISVLVRNQPGEVLKAALLAGDLAAAEHNIAAEWGNESLYEGRVRLFKADRLREMLISASLVPRAERGVRVISDYLPQNVSRNSQYERIFELERKLGSLPEFAAVARYVQCVAHLAGPMKDMA